MFKNLNENESQGLKDVCRKFSMERNQMICIFDKLINLNSFSIVNDMNELKLCELR